MAGFIRFHSFTKALAEKKHDLTSDSLKIVLTLEEPSIANNQVKADLEGQLAPGNGYPEGGLALKSQHRTEAGKYELWASPLYLKAEDGDIGPFRFVVLYNASAAGQELLGFWDYGEPVTVLTDEVFPLKFSDGILSLG